MEITESPNIAYPTEIIRENELLENIEDYIDIEKIIEIVESNKPNEIKGR